MNEIDQVKPGEEGERAIRRTLLALVSIAQLLESTADLLRGPMFAGLFEDEFRDGAIPVRESTMRFCGPGVGGLITRETWRREG